MGRRMLYWFRNDQRLHDHPILGKLQADDALLPVFVIDPEGFALTPYGFPKASGYRAQFLLESLTDLREQLRAKGSDLCIRVGKAAEILPKLAQQWEASVIIGQREDTYEEIQEEEAVTAASPVPVEWWQGQTLIHEDDIPFPLESLPNVFTQFRKKVEKYSEVRATIPEPDILPAFPSSIDPGELPTLADLHIQPRKIDERAAISFKGGTAAGKQRLQDYFWNGDHLRNYKFTRNGLIGEDYSSKFSAWLANGNLSPRYIYEEVKRYEQERKKNVSTYWLVFELLWRDYFRYVAKRFGKQIFQKDGVKGEEKAYRNRSSDFEAWMQGETGEPFVDANMKELLLTGFMSNRGRQNVASYLTKDLQVDWRWGAAWFESQLIDYDVCSNWGNWMYVAGVGNDPREDRYFNVRSQAERYDPDGAYQRLWLGE